MSVIGLTYTRDMAINLDGSVGCETRAATEKMGTSAVVMTDETRAAIQKLAIGAVFNEKTRVAIDQALAPHRELATKVAAVSQKFASPPWLEQLKGQLASIQAQTLRVSEVPVLPSPRMVEFPTLGGYFDDLAKGEEERERAEDEVWIATLETPRLLRDIVELQGQVLAAITTIAAEAQMGNRSQTRRFWSTVPLAVLAAAGVYPVIERLFS